jgi:hypothetical protein
MDPPASICLPGGGPWAVGAAFHFHAAGCCVVVDPSCQFHYSRDRSRLGVFLPTCREIELYISGNSPGGGLAEIEAQLFGPAKLGKRWQQRGCWFASAMAAYCLDEIVE